MDALIIIGYLDARVDKPKKLQAGDYFFTKWFAIREGKFELIRTQVLNKKQVKT